jgi:hypothetical protein
MIEKIDRKERREKEKRKTLCCMTRRRTGVVELAGGLDGPASAAVESRFKRLKKQNTSQRFEVLMLKRFVERLVRNGIVFCAELEFVESAAGLES